MRTVSSVRRLPRHFLQIAWCRRHCRRPGAPGRPDLVLRVLSLLSRSGLALRVLGADLVLRVLSLLSRSDLVLRVLGADLALRVLSLLILLLSCARLG